MSFFQTDSKNTALPVAKAEDLFDEIRVCEDEEECRQKRHDLLALCAQHPDLVRSQKIATFVATHVTPEDYTEVEWDDLDQMVHFCEVMYGRRFSKDIDSENTQWHVRHLLKDVLLAYEKQGDTEEMLLLWQTMPALFQEDDPELWRIRRRIHLYEMRRVRRWRRLLYIYLLVQSLLVLIVFPLLFINAENGQLQQQVEQLTDVELGDDGYRTYSFTDGLYWSVITAGSIGYGDITPLTTTGKIIAGILGTIGVLTVGVVAGLVLELLTPRQLASS